LPDASSYFAHPNGIFSALRLRGIQESYGASATDGNTVFSPCIRSANNIGGGKRKRLPFAKVTSAGNENLLRLVYRDIYRSLPATNAASYRNGIDAGLRGGRSQETRVR
jgi:hypothetical protein